MGLVVKKHSSADDSLLHGNASDSAKILLRQKLLASSSAKKNVFSDGRAEETQCLDSWGYGTQVECLSYIKNNGLDGISRASDCKITPRERQQAVFKPAITGKLSCYAMTCGIGWLYLHAQRNRREGRKSLARAQFAAVAFGLCGVLVLMGVPPLMFGSLLAGGQVLRQRLRGSEFKTRTAMGYREDVIVRRLLDLQNKIKVSVLQSLNQEKATIVELAELAMVALGHLEASVERHEQLRIRNSDNIAGEIAVTRRMCAMLLSNESFHNINNRQEDINGPLRQSMSWHSS